MGYIGSEAIEEGNNVAVFDTALPAGLMKQYRHFVKTAVKERHRLKYAEVPISRLKS